MAPLAPLVKMQTKLQIPSTKNRTIDLDEDDAKTSLLTVGGGFFCMTDGAASVDSVV